MIQYRSRQALKFGKREGTEDYDEELEQFEMLSQQDPELMRSLTAKQAGKKDPCQSQRVDAAWNKYKDFSQKQVSTHLRPNILRMDRDGCSSIQNKIEIEKAIENHSKMWLQENRLKTRQRFLRRHEQNIQKEASIKGEYKSILSYVKKRASTVHGSRSRPLTGAEPAGTRFYEGDEQVMEEDHFPQPNGEEEEEEPEKPSLNEEEEDDEAQEDDGGFKIRFVKPMFPSMDPTSTRLSQPKPDPEIRNLYDHQDFRGLYHADYQQVIRGIHRDPTCVQESTIRYLNTNVPQTAMTSLIRNRAKQYTGENFVTDGTQDFKHFQQKNRFDRTKGSATAQEINTLYMKNPPKPQTAFAGSRNFSRPGAKRPVSQSLRATTLGETEDEVQESMRQLDAFEERHKKKKIGYSRMALERDLKGLKMDKDEE